MNREQLERIDRDRISLKEKVAIVTGAAQGIGRATADILSGLGAKVMLQDLDEVVLNHTFNNLLNISRKVSYCSGNICKETDIKKLVNTTLDTWGRIDILVNNAGIGGVGKTILELSKEEWQEMIDVDLTSIFLTCQAVIPHMIAHKRGTIINISSITAQMGVEGSTHYAAAKAGVIGFSKSLAREVARYFINVNVISPGLIDTRMSRRRGINHQRDLVIWPRIGNVNDIAWSVAYLASDQAEFITGAVININGGAYM